MAEAKYQGIGMIVDFPGGGQDYVVYITIDCPHCGEIRMEIPGHHLQAIRNTFIEQSDYYQQFLLQRQPTKES